MITYCSAVYSENTFPFPTWVSWFQGEIDVCVTLTIFAMTFTENHMYRNYKIKKIPFSCSSFDWLEDKSIEHKLHIWDITKIHLRILFHAIELFCLLSSKFEKLGKII